MSSQRHPQNVHVAFSTTLRVNFPPNPTPQPNRVSDLDQTSECNRPLSPTLSSAETPYEQLGNGIERVHTIALAIVTPIRKTVIEAPKSSVCPYPCDAAPLYYPRNIRPTRRLTRLARRLQSW